MELSLYTLLTNKFTLVESLKLAQAAGFDAVDLRQGRDDKDPVHLSRAITDPEVAEVRREVEAIGLQVSGLTTYYRLGMTHPPDAAAELRGLRRAFTIAHNLGARYLRCSGAPIGENVTYESARAAFRRQVEEVAPVAEEHRIVLTLEQHPGYFFASAGQILDMLRGLEHPYLGIVYDPGNTLWEGFERPAVQIDMLGNLIRAVHVKNAMPRPSEGPAETLPADPTRLDQGLLDWPALVAQLENQADAAYLTLEDFFDGFGSVERKLAWDVAYLRSLLK